MDVYKERVTLAVKLTIPSLSTGLFVGLLFLLFHIGLGRVTVPDWYTATAGQSAPVHEFINYWIQQAIIYGAVTFGITLIAALVLFIFRSIYIS